MKTIPTQLPIILDYMNKESGKEKVKERLDNIYGWLACKLSRTTNLEQLKKLKTQSTDPQVQDQWGMVIKEALAEDDLFYEELKVRLDEGVEIIQNNDPEWFQSYQSSQNSQKVATSREES